MSDEKLPQDTSTPLSNQENEKEIPTNQSTDKTSPTSETTETMDNKDTSDTEVGEIPVAQTASEENSENSLVAEESNDENGAEKEMPAEKEPISVSANSIEEIGIPEENSAIVKTSEDEEEDEEEVKSSEDEEAEEEHDEKAQKDYSSLSEKELVAELDRLLKTKKIQELKHDVEEIRAEFNNKFNEELEQKKEEF